MKLLLKRLLSLLPTRLPSGMQEFKSWADSIAELTGPIATKDSIEFVLSDMLQRSGTIKNSKYGTFPGYIPKNHFVQGLIAAAAKQVAGQVFFEIKTKQQEAALAAQAADTANTDKAPSNGSGQTKEETQ